MIKKAMDILEYMKNDIRNYTEIIITSHLWIMDTTLSGICYTIFTSTEIPHN